MALHDVMLSVVEPKGEPGEKKHYIPFNKEEFAKLRKAFGRPEATPNDFKKILLGIADGVFELSVAKPKA